MQDENLLYQNIDWAQRTHQGRTLSYVLHESPFTSVLTVTRGHPSLREVCNVEHMGSSFCTQESVQLFIEIKHIPDVILKYLWWNVFQRPPCCNLYVCLSLWAETWYILQYCRIGGKTDGAGAGSWYIYIYICIRGKYAHHHQRK